MTTTTKENKEREILEAKYLRAQEKRMDILSRVVESCTMLEGKKGRGKTITGVALSYNLREAFNMPTICVGSRMGLIKDIYGPYEFIDERDFLLICPKCKLSHPRHKKPTRECACTICCKKYSDGKYDDRFRLIVRKEK